MYKRSFLNTMEIINKGILEYYERKKNTMEGNKYMGKYNFNAA